MKENNFEHSNLPSNSEQNKKGLMPILIICIALVIALGGYIVYDKVLSKNSGEQGENESKTSSESTPSDNQQETLPEWVTYLLNQNISSIKYVYAGNIDDEHYECKEKDVTKEQLKKIFERMTAFNLKKYDAGGAGSACNDEGLTIKYGNNKTLSIFQNMWITVDEILDSELKTLIEKDVDINEKVVSSDPWLVYEFEWDNSYVDWLLKIK